MLPEGFEHNVPYRLSHFYFLLEKIYNHYNHLLQKQV